MVPVLASQRSRFFGGRAFQADVALGTGVSLAAIRRIERESEVVDIDSRVFQGGCVAPSPPGAIVSPRRPGRRQASAGKESTRMGSGVEVFTGLSHHRRDPA